MGIDKEAKIEKNVRKEKSKRDGEGERQSKLDDEWEKEKR